MSAPQALTIRSLFLYPVKGLGGIETPMASLGARGLEGDRRWMVVDSRGHFLSQRTHPGMVRIHCEFREGGSVLRLSRTGQEPLDLPARPESLLESTLLPVVVWDDELPALAPFPHADRWMSELLGEPVQLVYQPDTVRRPTDPRYAPEGEVSFADGYPLLVVGEPSLEALNQRLDTPVSWARFRPNVVVEGDLEPHAEDSWRRFTLDGVSCAGVKPCARCSVPGVNPETGEQGAEPLRTLAHYRRWKGKVWFGQNAVPLGTGELRVGGAVTVEETAPVVFPD